MDYNTSVRILTCIGYDCTSSSNSSIGYVKGSSMIITTLNGNDKFKHLLGSNGEQYAEVTSWLSLVGSLLSEGSSCFPHSDLVKIDNILLTKSYLVANGFTVADVALYVAINQSIGSCHQYKNLIRWFDHVQHICSPYSKQHVITFANTVLLIPLTLKSDDSLNNKAPVVKVDKGSSSNSNTNTNTNTTASASASVEKSSEKHVKKEKDKKEEKKASEEKPDEKKEEELDPSKLDVRIGVILKCHAHPEAEKLLVEQIDLGEATPRTICSGLKAFYTPEEMVGRSVLVLANLKDRTMVGVKSQGMVLCACNNDHSKVTLLEIPSSAKPGDRVVFKGFEGEPASSSVVAKKKILEGIAPFLKTNDDGVCVFRDIPFTVNGEIVKAVLKNGIVS